MNNCVCCENEKPFRKHSGTQEREREVLEVSNLSCRASAVLSLGQFCDSTDKLTVNIRYKSHINEN